MTAGVTLNMIDRSGEPTRTKFYFPALTGANYEATVGNTVTENVGNLRLAVAALTLCNMAGTVVTAVTYPEVASTPSDPNAQREIALKFFYIDNVNGRKGNFTVPGPELTGIAQANTDEVDMANIAIAAFVAVVEAEAVSRDGNAITIVRGRIVGRAS